MTATLGYSNGVLTITGFDKCEERLPFTKYDERIGGCVCEAVYYATVKEYLSTRGIEFTDRAAGFLRSKGFEHSLALREYQLEAYQKWLDAGKRGVVVLPTGAGKTAIGIHAAATLGVSTLVVVPTIDLLNQWATAFKRFGVQVGILGGGDRDVLPLTVTTYDSASIYYSELGARFELLVFDEVHHLPSQVNSRIALGSLAPYRLGLTATLERDDGLHALLPLLVGPLVYSGSHTELVGKYLSDFELEVVRVSLSKEEKRRYDELMGVYRHVLQKYRIHFKNPEDFKKLVMLSGSNREVRRALLAKNDAMRLAFNASGKLEVLRGVFERFRGEKMIVFTQYNDVVNRISREFLVPSITHTTPKEEREEILNLFREGHYRCIVTSKVLDEGVDVPDASVGVILSGTGSKREFIQRLGRILRKKDGKVARLVEVVTAGTSEVGTSRRRNVFG